MRALTLLLLCAGAALPQGPGLVAVYSDGKARATLVVPTPNFYLDAPESPHPSVRAAFEAEWIGRLTVLQAGEYRFHAGDAELTIDGTRHSANAVALGPGPHDLRIRYRRHPGVASLRLEWESNHFPREPVPASAFTHLPAQAPPLADRLAEQGRALAAELGCVNCHSADSAQLVGRRAATLDAASDRFSAAWLYKWLEDPKAYRSGAVMPALAGADARRDITAYLASLRGGEPAGRARAPRPLDVAEGSELAGSLGCAACHRTDEGLTLDGLGSKTTVGALAEFLLEPARFDPSSRMPSMLLSKEEAFQLASYLVESRNSEFETPPPPGDAARGKSLLASQGCLACHAIEGQVNTLHAPALARLHPDAGCLAETPPAAVPQYRLRNGQKTALRAFLNRYRRQPDVAAAPVYRTHLALRELRCVNCHSSDFGPAAVPLNEAAPPLEDIGAKLRSNWMARVMTGKARSRKYLALRMPHYGAGADTLDLAKASGLAPGDGAAPPVFAQDAHQRGAGMIGTDPKQGGMGCVGCHDWGEYKSLGEEGPQLIDVTQRLRYDWYTRWMHNPARILSGTSMPSYFSAMESGRASQTIAALWAGMSLSDKMPLPAGLGKVEASMDAEARPVPDKEPVVVRWDMPEATPAAIAVGLPGGLSFCFDAGESRLRYAWTGGFVDLTETLTRKTDRNRLTPTAAIVGEVFYRSPGFPFRVEAPDRVPQRRFRGYRITGGAIEFRYDIDSIQVVERIVARAKQSGMQRQFTFSNVNRAVWFVDPALDGSPREIPRGAGVRFDVSHPVRRLP